MITREQARRLAEVATAIAEGKRVTHRSGPHAGHAATIVFSDGDYTIHEPPPEPKYRPWTLEEAIDNIGRVVRRKDDKAARLIVSVYDYDGDAMLYLGGLECPDAADDVLEEYEFLDGTPCGAQE